METFQNLYKVTKTLRFELKPVGSTATNISNSELLKQDEQRASDYKEMKKLIDKYHKDFIERSLSKVELDISDLTTYKESLEKKEDTQKISEKLRKQVVSCFDTDRLFGKELITEDLLEFVDTAEDKELVAKFNKWTTYFNGFHKNRENMYTDEEQSTSIAYRLLHQNFPKFLTNMKSFEKLKASNAVRDYSEIFEDVDINKLSPYFTISGYNSVLTQKQITDYNAIIGGRAEESGDKIQGLNEKINLYNQQQNDKKDKLPKFIPLFKQILSDKESLSWLPDMFSDDAELLNSINDVYCDIKDKALEEIKKLLCDMDEFDLSKIYLRNDTSLTNISQRMFGNWNKISEDIKSHLSEKDKQNKKGSIEKYEERIGKAYEKQKFLSIEYINKCILVKDEDEPKYKDVIEYFKSFNNKDDKNLFDIIDNHYKEFANLYENKDDVQLRSEPLRKQQIKNFLDSIKDLQHFIKPLCCNVDIDANFYERFDKFWDILDEITPLYNKVRNYLTQKPYKVEKFKLNFENSTLLNGWDVNKEPDNTSVLLRKDGLYYLAIMDKKNNGIFKEKLPQVGECYEKIDYKLLPGANKMLPKVFFAKFRIDNLSPEDKIIHAAYKKGTHKKGNLFNLVDCHRLIDFFKRSISNHPDWSKFDFHFANTSEYEDISAFYREVELQGYKLSFRNIPAVWIDEMVNAGKLYLFQIYNKDFSTHSKGTPNMHTQYWRMLFDENNLKDTIYKLNGEAEVFYRKKSIKDENTIIHKANQPIKNKNENNDKPESTFGYDIIKDRRYTMDKFLFHVPITMNFKEKGINKINTIVNQYIKDNQIQHIIGIDRGERHLLYLCLIDLDGNIIEQHSLNEIVNEYKGEEHKTDYHKLLATKEDKRNDARQSWDTIENIKELKEGYLSNVIHKIALMMIERKAIVVLEDLNFGFIRGRQKVEKSVYQKFEKMLIDKLNYLVLHKDEEKSNEDGGLLKAYQLTNAFESFEKMGKQSGFLFYIPAWNTSKIDPITGFVNMFDTRYASIDKSKEFFGKFADVRYNAEKNYFEFVVDNYTDFNGKAKGRQDWIICTNGDRIKNFRNPDKNNQWDSEPNIMLTNEFAKILPKENIKEFILKQSEKSFFEELLHLLKLTLQMRNNIPNTDTDYLISPIADENGNFYDSRKADKTKPKDADANGAYNIARKGLMIVERIKEAEEIGKIDLKIPNEDYLNYIQNK
ncbi:MAG: type V CRISPR-associated protein Cas12a/Cpf1 [Ignavibacteria bacterium]|jgi:CRISPR-associated protein Cpf1|nr:type V CRISPR-associated protein Cas12a/Cpf1 [Ignavibacteria bacterium]